MSPARVPDPLRIASETDEQPETETAGQVAATRLSVEVPLALARGPLPSPQNPATSSVVSSIWTRISEAGSGAPIRRPPELDVIVPFQIPANDATGPPVAPELSCAPPHAASTRQTIPIPVNVPPRANAFRINEPFSRNAAESYVDVRPCLKDCFPK